MVFKKSLGYIQSLYLTTSHYFLHYIFFYVFEYFILLLCIITFTIDYCYVLLHTPSHVWPEFNKLLSIVSLRTLRVLGFTQGRGARSLRHNDMIMII